MRIFVALPIARSSVCQSDRSRRAGSAEFLALLDIDEKVENPLLAIGAAKKLQSAMAKWVVGDPPTPQPLMLLGSDG